MMKKRWVYVLLVLLAMLTFAACGAEEAPAEPNKDDFRRDVQEYVTDILDSSAVIRDFAIQSSELADGVLTATCAVSYSGEDGDYEGTFTLTYGQSQQEWQLEKCRVELAVIPEETQPEETEAEPTESDAEETTVPEDTDCEHSYITTKVAPTTTTRGYYNHKCKYCGYVFNDNFVPPLTTETTPGDAEVPVATEGAVTDPENPGGTGTVETPDAGAGTPDIGAEVPSDGTA